MPDHWGWVEEDTALGVKPIFGHVTGRNFFPPDFGHPSVSFQKFDATSPTFNLSGPQNYSPGFGDFDEFCGWNGPMDMSAAINRTDTTSSGTRAGFVGQTARLTAIDTSDTDLRNWNLLPGHFDITGLSFVPQSARFIPFTNIVAFIGTDMGVSKLMAVELSSMTRVMSVSMQDLTGNPGTILAYNYSYDGEKIAITFSGTTGTWVFLRNGIHPISPITTSNIFGTQFPSNVRYTDDSKFLFVWGIPSSGMELYRADPPYTPIEIASPGTGQGLFGPTAYATEFASYHPRNLFFQLSGTISLGLGGSNNTTPFFDEDLLLVGNGGGSSEAPLFGDWSATGDCWIGTDGGRDPNGGTLGLINSNYLATHTGNPGSGASPQEWGDIRCRPYH